MLAALLALQIVTLLALIVVALRKSGTAGTAASSVQDPRLAQLLDANLPARLEGLDARSAVRLDGIEQHLRSELAASRADATSTSAALRTEVLGNITTLGSAQREALEAFRADNSTAAERLRTAVEAQLTTLSQRLTGFTAENTRHQAEAREALHTSLQSLAAQQTEQHEKLRAAMQDRLDKLNTDNTAKLEEMRATVDEKLHATLQNRLTESFGQVTDQLTKVHAGLGEMTKLSAGVDDLSRIFTNVKVRGGFAEVQLGMLLQQMLAPNQYQQNVKVKPNTQELVEYAVKFPTANGEMLMPIDSKFNKDAWERLESAYGSGSATDIASAGKIFETAIRNEAKKICEKYIAPPTTTSFAVMFLPTEGIYAEVMRRDGLQSDIQQQCRVTIAGPSTLSAILSSFQMGFHMLQMQEKGDEVWKVLAGARKEFGTFEVLMDKMTADVGRVQGTIDKLGIRTRAINRTLRDVAESESSDGNLLSFVEKLPLLAATGEEEDV